MTPGSRSEGSNVRECPNRNIVLEQIFICGVKEGQVKSALFKTFLTATFNTLLPPLRWGKFIGQGVNLSPWAIWMLVKSLGFF